MITSKEIATPEIFEPGSFEASRHFYPRTTNATIHPLVSFFFNLSQERIISRYCHLNPTADPQALRDMINYQPKYMRWGGVDLIHCTTATGNREMVVIETNSSPSGHKSTPLLQDHLEHGSYMRLVERTIVPAIKRHRLKKGAVAVLYDKNYMENAGYAATLADALGAPVYLIPCFDTSEDVYHRFTEGLLEIRTDKEADTWIPIRAALRYVTQRPWNRIPANTKTLMLNPIVTCLSGGRNKLVASMAYELLNADLSGTGLEIRFPETVRDVSLAEVPLLFKTFGGKAVVKVPYGNAGQGVFILSSERELEEFCEKSFEYDRFIVQSLIGNYAWSSEGVKGKYYQVGTVPNKRNQIFVADIRLLLGATETGFAPMAVYSRKAREALRSELDDSVDPFDMLVTNLSMKLGTDAWDTDTSRLLMLDRKDFNLIGVGLDALISGYIQSVLCLVAIDRMAASLVNSKGRFRMKFFRSINNDPSLHEEIRLD